MFEKEAEEHCNKQCSMCGVNDWIPCQAKCHDWQDEYGSWKDGAEFGYNKANEWHFVKDGDLPKEDLRPRTLGYYLTASKHKSYKGFVFEVAYFTGVVFIKGGDILDNVIAWKEIVLPELKG